jgi:hypothetical protein
MCHEEQRQYCVVFLRESFHQLVIKTQHNDRPPVPALILRGPGEVNSRIQALEDRLHRIVKFCVRLLFALHDLLDGKPLIEYVVGHNQYKFLSCGFTSNRKLQCLLSMARS